MCKHSGFPSTPYGALMDPGSDQVSLDLILADQGTLYRYDRIACYGFPQVGSANAQSAPPEEDTTGILVTHGSERIPSDWSVYLER